jgi:organic hydroperoxide reductase OsmC/OhrA
VVLIRYFSKHINRATAEGRARAGHASSVGSGAPLDLELTNPKAIGGPGTGQTPEQLLGMAYASTFYPKILLQYHDTYLPFLFV